ncbi:unnamed protein product, partial [Laminaria digitata]
ACGVSLPGTETPQSQSTTPPDSDDRNTIPYLPGLVEACLGVAGGRASRAPFIGASAACSIVDAAILAGASDAAADAAADAARVAGEAGPRGHEGGTGCVWGGTGRKGK